jgi:hypothetical protein
MIVAVDDFPQFLNPLFKKVHEKQKLA